MNQEHPTLIENTPLSHTYSKEAYETASQVYEDTKRAIGGDKSDEEIMALVVARADASDKLAGLYAQAWQEADAVNADMDDVRRKAWTFAKLSRPEQLQELLRREFTRGVEHIPEGRYTSDLLGVEQLSVLHPQKNSPETPARSFSVYVSHVDPESQKRSGETFTVTNEGRVLGVVPRGWNFTKDELVEEIVRHDDDVGGTFFIETHDAILPPGDWETGDGDGKGKNRGSKKEPEDRRRLRFFKNQPGALFGFRGAKATRWQDYRGFAFSDRIILDAPTVGNAVYVITLANEFPVDPKRLSLPPGFRVNEEDRERYLEEHWSRFSGLSKQESLHAGATRVIHPDYDIVDDQWEKKMCEKLNMQS